MSQIVSSPAEIPNAVAYVLANDSFFSGWGRSPGINTVVFPCDSWEEVDKVKEKLDGRTEMKYVRVCGNKPRLREGITYSLFSKEKAGSWYE